MCSTNELREAVSVWAADFDATALTVEQCRRVVEEATAIVRMAAAVQSQAAARVAASGSWRDAGDQSAAHQLARETGSTVGAARESLQTGERLAALPQLAEAAQKGLLSPAQTAAVAAVGEVAPELVGELVARAQETTVGQLREEC